MPSKNLSLSPVQGGKAALHGRKKEIFGGGKPPPNPHHVSPVCKACLSVYSSKQGL